MQSLSFRQSLNLALDLEMQKDPDVFVYGLDVDDHKAIFGSVSNLLSKYGPERVFGTPLSEEAMTGFGIGAALNGKKAVHVHIRADFAILALNQIINMASNINYMTAGSLNVPLTIRIVVGRGWGQGMQHCKSLHSTLAHFPGLKVFVPSSPQEAYSMMRQAVQDPNPVVFIEHRWLYDVEGPVDPSILNVPSVRQVTQGENLTIVSSSWMTVEALKAQEILKTFGIQADIFNLSAISELDLSNVYASVSKTGHCIVADHDWSEFGLASEISARIHENAFAHLKKPVKRIGFSFFPCPTARPLENHFYPGAKDIIQQTCELLAMKTPDLSGFDFYTYENKFRGPF